MQSENRKDFDLDRLLHPAGAFRTPMEVVQDPDMTTQEKRAILASWASDACAVEDFPEFRQPTGAAPVKFDDIMDALRGLDAELERRVGATTNTVGRRRCGPEESEDVSLV